MKTIGIALVGKMHAGKGEVASILSRDFRFIQKSFADPVKKASYRAYRAIDTYLGLKPMEYQEFLDNKDALRWMPQGVGTNYVREYRGEPDFWVNFLKMSYEVHLMDCLDRGEDCLVVVDDCRFVNEADALREMGFHIVKIERTEKERLASVRAAVAKTLPPDVDSRTLTDLVASKLNHESERQVDMIEADYNVANYGSLAHLTRVVHIFMDQIQ